MEFAPNPTHSRGTLADPAVDFPRSLRTQGIDHEARLRVTVLAMDFADVDAAVSA